MRVHLAVEHALELEMAHLGFQALRVALDVARGSLVASRFRELQQLGGLGDALGGAVDLADVGGQAGAFAPELLRARRVRPDGRIFELAAPTSSSRSCLRSYSKKPP